MVCFGVWRVCKDGKAHYYLPDGALCGTRSEQTDAPVVERGPGASGQGASEDVSETHCRTCLKKNWLRWAGVS